MNTSHCHIGIQNHVISNCELIENFVLMNGCHQPYIVIFSFK